MAATTPYTVIGKPIPRVEGPEKVSGGAVYTADVVPANTLWGVIVRSTVPHARIVSIDITRARAVPGVRAVITAADIPNKRTGRHFKDLPLLADDRVRFVGDRIAAVAAETRDAAQEAALLVDIVYEELPAVFDPLVAMTPGAPLIHPDVRSYVGFPHAIPADLPNLASYKETTRGDVTRGFAEADVVIEHTFQTQLAHQGYLEPTACVVSLASDATVDVWASNKMPYILRDELAWVLERPATDFVIHAVKVGADFGAKSITGDSFAGYYLAQATGRPIKFVNTAFEDLTAASPRHPSIVTLRTGLTRDGRMVAREARVIFNGGAYGAFRPAEDGMLGGGTRAGSCYTIPNLHIDAYCVYTNQIPCGYMRAPGNPQVFTAVEVHTDLIARELGMDPVELRLRNLPDRWRTGEEDLSKRMVRTAADAIGLHAPRANKSGRIIGRGISLISRGTGAGEGSSDITVEADGTITARTAMPDNGTGGLTVVAQVVAESFGVPMDRVRVIQSGTDAFAVDVGSGGSKMTNVAGHAAQDASEMVKAQLQPLAAQALSAAAVSWSGAQVDGAGNVRPGGWTGDNGRFISLEDLATEMIHPNEPAAHAQVTIDAPRAEILSYCVQAAEVEIDVETGAVQLRKLVTVNDVGTIVNEIGHQSQIEGGVMQGIGYCLMEELVVEDGHIATSNLGDYKMPTIADIPELVTINIPQMTGPGPFAAKGIGERPTIPTAGAITNAVINALGTPILQIPITAERVLTALDALTPRK